MEGRGTATRGSDRAARFIGETMRTIGLQPAGDSGFFQRVPILVAVDSATKARQLDLLVSWRAFDALPPDRRAVGANVIGIIEGADSALRREVVLIDAHYDHLGIGRPQNGDSIYNGADDDASGVVAVLEIARLIAGGPPPKRTMIFAATTGEEVGLLGTRWYIAHPVRPIESMAANLEIEMIGRPDSLAGGAGKGWLTGYERSTMGDQLKAAGIPLVADPRPAQNFFERSDNIAFALRGIPAHTLSSYNMHTDYHTPIDDMTHVDAAHMAQVISAAARAARILADGPKPEWKPGGRPTPRR
jgi:Zn-dependent M28 family amino/carboxypeptidase